MAEQNEILLQSSKKLNQWLVEFCDNGITGWVLIKVDNLLNGCY